MVKEKENPTCGIIMPISEIDGCDPSHWTDVHEILKDAIKKASYDPKIVSMSSESGLIQKRIVQNLYENPIVVCDVSGKNPNVMFELGMRLAFDKPTIIVKDDKTSYTFDTGQIEHIEYPRDLRFAEILKFKAILSAKIEATTKAAKSDENYTTFLKHFGTFTVAKIDEKEVSGQEFLLEEIKSIQHMLGRMNNQDNRSFIRNNRERENSIDFCVESLDAKSLDLVIATCEGIPGVVNIRIMEFSPKHKHIEVTLSSRGYRDRSVIRRIIKDEIDLQSP